MRYKQAAAIAVMAAMVTGSAMAQVGGGSIGGNGTVGGGGSVGGTTLGTGSRAISPGNQSPAPGNPVLPNDTRSGTGSTAGQTFRVPGNSSQAEPQGGLTDNSQGVDRAPTASTTPPQSIIDQPTPPSIPSPSEAGSDPSEIDLRNDNLPAQ